MERHGTSAPPSRPHDVLPDVRDGLTRLERVILFVTHEAEKEWGGRPVPTATIYGRVVEHVNVSVEEFQAALVRLVGRAAQPPRGFRGR